ncbi:hypothetical protein MN608_06607 [Microdochium nivale]|nr:hypothetical protein MN608_06607 [Microdochium nivale]
MRSSQYMFLFGAVSASAAFTSEVNCVTPMGPKPVEPVETVTLSSTSTLVLPDATSTSVVTNTVTEAPVTNTETSTTQVTVTETDSTVTDTFTSTSTSTEIRTDTTTETQTSTDTATVTTTVIVGSVVATPPGFVPISDSVNGYPQRKRDVRHPRDCHHKPTASHATYVPSTSTTYAAASGTCLGEYSQYPQSVQCSETTTAQQTVIVTGVASVTSTITPPPVTSTTTETFTSTSTEVPRAQTTETVTETTTATTTVTETTATTTTTTTTAEATSFALTYEACGPRNILGPRYNGSPISNVFNGANNGQAGGGAIYDNTAAASAEDCCVSCVTKTGCTGSVFAGGRCVLLRNQQRSCGSQSSNVAAFVVSPGSASSGYVLSNGLCGYQKFAPQ